MSIISKTAADTDSVRRLQWNTKWPDVHLQWQVGGGLESGGNGVAGEKRCAGLTEVTPYKHLFYIVLAALQIYRPHDIMHLLWLYFGIVKNFSTQQHIWCKVIIKMLQHRKRFDH